LPVILDAGTISYRDPETGKLVEVPVTGGQCKMQWKADWAMRWVGLGVDYEMAGKDLSESVTLSSRISRILGSVPPEGFSYELFLDENGEKISKSRGNGLTMEDWLKYGTPESLSFYMYQSPRKAKKLHFDIIPKTVDDYITHLARYPDQDNAQQLANAVWHVHNGTPPMQKLPVSFAMLLNLVSASNADDKQSLWGYVSSYAQGAGPEEYPLLDQLMDYALVYYENFVKPNKKYRSPTEDERRGLESLVRTLTELADNLPAADYQNAVFAVGNEQGYDTLRDWFSALYEILLGQKQGPRMGSFIALYGRRKTIDLITGKLAGYK